LLFAWAAEDMKSRNWIGSHRRMYAYYGGVPHVTVPDSLRQGVVKCHLYDPDLNEDYAHMAAHFSTAIVPAPVRGLTIPLSCARCARRSGRGLLDRPLTDNVAHTRALERAHLAALGATAPDALPVEG
jgi:hypothetical protein